MCASGGQWVGALTLNRQVCLVDGLQVPLARTTPS